MTDKQIINEIDISKCEFCHSGEYCYIYSGTASFEWMCEENEDCQIKKLLLQLKAKEQECETLGQAYLETNELLQEKTKECTNLKAENDTLFKAIEEVNKINKRLESKKENYIQTLTEIKEIAEEIEDECGYLGWSSCANKAKEQILQKISEVESD